MARQLGARGSEVIEEVNQKLHIKEAASVLNGESDPRKGEVFVHMKQ